MAAGLRREPQCHVFACMFFAGWRGVGTMHYVMGTVAVNVVLRWGAGYCHLRYHALQAYTGYYCGAQQKCVNCCPYMKAAGLGGWGWQCEICKLAMPPNSRISCARRVVRGRRRPASRSAPFFTSMVDGTSLQSDFFRQGGKYTFEVTVFMLQTTPHTKNTAALNTPTAGPIVAPRRHVAIGAGRTHPFFARRQTKSRIHATNYDRKRWAPILHTPVILLV